MNVLHFEGKHDRAVRRLLGECLIRGTIPGEALELLSASVRDPMLEHAVVAALEVRARGGPVDLVTVWNEFERVKGNEQMAVFLSELVDAALPTMRVDEE